MWSNMNEQLHSALTTGGVAAKIKDGWIECGDSVPAMRAHHSTRITYENGTMLGQLDVQASLPAGRLLTFSCASPGENEAESAGAAFQKFSVGTLRAILAAVYDCEEPQVNQSTYAAKDIEWNLFETKLMYRGPSQAAGELGEEIPPQLDDLVSSTLAMHVNPEHSVQWAHVYSGRMGKTRICEFLLNNIKLDTAEQQLAGLDWPVLDEFQAISWFMILRDPNRDEFDFSEDYRHYCHAVRLMLKTAKEQPDSDMDQLIASLVKSGIREEIAEEIYLFAATAFAHIIFSEIKFPTEYHGVNRDGVVVKNGSLLEEPAYCAARDVAGSGTEDPKQIASFALHSAVADALNNLAHQGSDLKGVEAGPDMVYLPRYDLLPVEKKPWWKFW